MAITSRTFSVSRGLRNITFMFGLLGLLMVSNVASASLFGSDIKGSGNIKEQTRDVGHFNALSVGLPADVQLRQGNIERVTISTDDNILPLVGTVVENGVLKIQPAHENTSFSSTKLIVIVEAKDINNISIGGSGTIVADKLNAPRLSVAIGGSGIVQISGLSSDALSISLGGSGGFKASGVANSIAATIGGSGSVLMGHLEAKTVEVTLGGSGHAIVWAKSALRLMIAGSGSVDYYGDPAVSRSVFGSGKVTQLGASPE